MSAGAARPAPMPSSAIDRQDVDDVVGVDRRPGEERQAGGDAREAGDQDRARAEADDQRLREPQRHRPMATVTGRNARPTSSAS